MFDGQVVRLDSALPKLSREFIRLRLTRANDLDLDTFQFDYDMTWSAVFLNADMTVYGRYGSRGKGAAESLISLEGLKRAMERALQLHGGYPGNKADLAGKQPRPYPWPAVHKVPVISRHLRDKGKDSCIHCHQIYAGLRQSMLLEGQPVPEALIWPYPLPDRVGLKVDPDDGRRVEAVATGSAAARAGLRVGDVIERMDGNPIISLADVQWALHGLAPGASTRLTVLRGGERPTLELTPRGSWRRTALDWRYSRLDLMPGLGLVDLTRTEREAAGLADGGLGLRVRWIFDQHPARKAGFRKGDVLVEFDGRTDIADLGVFLELLARDYAPQFRKKARIKVVVLRGSKRVRLRLPLVFGALE